MRKASKAPATFAGDNKTAATSADVHYTPLDLPLSTYEPSTSKILEANRTHLYGVATPATPLPFLATLQHPAYIPYDLFQSVSKDIFHVCAPHSILLIPSSKLLRARDVGK